MKTTVLREQLQQYGPQSLSTRRTACAHLFAGVHHRACAGAQEDAETLCRRVAICKVFCVQNLAKSV